MKLDFSTLELYVIIEAQLYLQVPISIENNDFTLLSDTKVNDYKWMIIIITTQYSIVTKFLINQECIYTDTYTYVYVCRVSFFLYI